MDETKYYYSNKSDQKNIPEHLETFELYLQYWENILTELKDFFDTKTLDEDLKKTLDTILECNEIKDNIDSICWEDYWLTC